MRTAALAFLGGILVMQQLPALPPPVWLAAFLPALVLAAYHPRFLLLVFFLAGAAWVSLRAQFILMEALPHELEGRDLAVEGVIADIPQPGDYGVRFALDVRAALVGSEPVRVPSRILLSYNPPEAPDPNFMPRVGDVYRMTVRLKRPHGFQNPGGFDYEAYLFRHRIRARGYVREKEPVERLGEARGLGYAIDRARQDLGERMRLALGDHPQTGVLVALANGDGRGIGDEQWDVFRRTGTLHLIAISGLHISLIAGVVFFLARFLWALPGVTVLRLPAPVFGAICGFAAALGYAALAGFVIPTQRALVMLAVALGAIVWRRRFPPSRLLAAALLAVLILDPLAVMATGFWLSFAAVAVIVYAVHADPGEGARWRAWGKVQYAVAVGLFPLLIALFQQASLSAPLANLLAVPVFDLLVVPLTLVGALLLGLGGDVLAAVPLQAAAWLLSMLWHALTALSELPHAIWGQHEPPVWALACAAVGVLLLLAPSGWPGRTLGIVWLLPLFLVRPAGPAPGELWFTLLDVGQGLAAVARTQTHTLVFDSGARFSPRFDAGTAVVAPYLRARGVERIDVLLISHGDQDHAGGAPALLANFPVARVLTGAPQLPGEACRAGQSWRWDGVDFAVLSPEDGRAGAHNNGSCVLHITSAHGSVLLPGDIEKQAEQRLLERGAALRADLLVAPHHGSRTSSTEAFLAAVAPRHVVFPVGYRNRYRHPHPRVVARYRGIAAQLYDSPSGGALEFRFGVAGVAADVYRQSHRRYWYDD